MEPDSTFSPALLKKVVHAAACSTSFRQAAEDLHVLGEVKVSAGRVRRAAEQVGHERVAQSQAAAETYLQLPLPARTQSPGAAVPQVACIQADGGRIQIRPRRVARKDQESWWRETKVGCLLSMKSAKQAEDPMPTIPATFVDPERVGKIAREIKGFSAEAAIEAVPEEVDEMPSEAPKIVSHTVVATRENVEAFGEMLAGAAYARGFGAAERKAFVADGSDTNWGLWRRHFSRYTPILDWVHAVCYVYAAAMASVASGDGWSTYCRWAQWLWSGEVNRILKELQERQMQLGLPTPDDADTSPRHRVADALRYLTNQRSRMNYPEYRRDGLPITSSHVESTIKRINRRMKGTEKFWDQGAEPLLHLVADHLGRPADLEAFWASRPSRLSSQRCYHHAA